MKTLWLCVCLFGLSESYARGDVINKIDLSTPALNGVSGFLVIDLLGGSPVAGNSAGISAFTSDWTLVSSSPSGGYSGNLVPGPLTLNDSQFFNEWSQQVIFGTHASFKIDLTTLVVQGGVPDDFAIYLLDSTGNPYVTTDPSGANALLNVSIDQLAPPVHAYNSSSATIVVSSAAPVPEPSTFVYLLSTLTVVCWRGKLLAARRMAKAGHART